MKTEFTSDEVQEVVQQIEDYFVHLKNEWDLQNPPSKSWWRIGRARLTVATIFLLNCLDNLIQFVEELITIEGAGSEKRSTVVAIITRLFDYIVAESFPIWLKPFVPAIRKIVIDIIIGSLIEFIVGKYNREEWTAETVVNG